MLKLFVVSVHVAHLECESEVEVESIHEGFSAACISIEYVRDNSFSPGELSRCLKCESLRWKLVKLNVYWFINNECCHYLGVIIMHSK